MGKELPQVTGKVLLKDVFQFSLERKPNQSTRTTLAAIFSHYFPHAATYLFGDWAAIDDVIRMRMHATYIHPHVSDEKSNIIPVPYCILGKFNSR